MELKNLLFTTVIFVWVAISHAVDVPEDRELVTNNIITEKAALNEKSTLSHLPLNYPSTENDNLSRYVFRSPENRRQGRRYMGPRMYRRPTSPSYRMPSRPVPLKYRPYSYPHRAPPPTQGRWYFPPHHYRHNWREKIPSNSLAYIIGAGVYGDDPSNDEMDYDEDEGADDPHSWYSHKYRDHMDDLDVPLSSKYTKKRSASRNLLMDILGGHPREVLPIRDERRRERERNRYTRDYRHMLDVPANKYSPTSSSSIDGSRTNLKDIASVIDMHQRYRSPMKFKEMSYPFKEKVEKFIRSHRLEQRHPMDRPSHADLERIIKMLREGETKQMDNIIDSMHKPSTSYPQEGSFDIDSGSNVHSATSSMAASTDTVQEPVYSAKYRGRNTSSDKELGEDSKLTKDEKKINNNNDDEDQSDQPVSDIVYDWKRVHNQKSSTGFATNHATSSKEINAPQFETRNVNRILPSELIAYMRADEPSSPAVTKGDRTALSSPTDESPFSQLSHQQYHPMFEKVTEDEFMKGSASSYPGSVMRKLTPMFDDPDLEITFDERMTDWKHK